jgi:hypothetical protein
MSYSTTLGRWMSADPSGYIDGANKYQAVGSAPAEFSDPSGLHYVGGMSKEQRQLSADISALWKKIQDDEMSGFYVGGVLATLGWLEDQLAATMPLVPIGDGTITRWLYTNAVGAATQPATRPPSFLEQDEKRLLQLIKAQEEKAQELQNLDPEGKDPAIQSNIKSLENANRKLQDELDDNRKRQEEKKNYRPPPPPPKKEHKPDDNRSYEEIMQNIMDMLRRIYGSSGPASTQP